MDLSTSVTKQLMVRTAVLVMISLSLLSGCLGRNLQDAPMVNDRPIIGILAEDVTSPHGKTFISSTYVRYLEQAGARVVPIRGNRTEAYYRNIVGYINGALIPGGAVDFATSMIGRSAKLVYNMALKLNQKGDYFPIWGTCMGFQLLCYLTEGNNLLKPTDSSNITWPLDFSAGYEKSRMFGSAPPEILKILSTQPVTQNEHSYSILTPVFEQSSLSKFYNKLSTNKDRKGVEFISSVEAKDYPIYGVQWHPEKNNFNWNPHYVINHSDAAVQVGQYMARFFVNEARKSQHRFPSLLAEAHSLVQNYKQVYQPDGTFYDSYFIDQ